MHAKACDPQREFANKPQQTFHHSLFGFLHFSLVLLLFYNRTTY